MHKSHLPLLGTLAFSSVAFVVIAPVVQFRFNPIYWLISPDCSKSPQTTATQRGLVVYRNSASTRPPPPQCKFKADARDEKQGNEMKASVKGDTFDYICIERPSDRTNVQSILALDDGMVCQCQRFYGLQCRLCTERKCDIPPTIFVSMRCRLMDWRCCCCHFNSHNGHQHFSAFSVMRCPGFCSK